VAVRTFVPALRRELGLGAVVANGENSASGGRGISTLATITSILTAAHNSCGRSTRCRGKPEVRDVLDQHLDPNMEPSLAIRAVYGWRFPQLTLIDESWAARNTSRIFPADESLQELSAAAWGAYVVFEMPHYDAKSRNTSEPNRRRRIGLDLENG
jgi:hypothetical protein